MYNASIISTGSELANNEILTSVLLDQAGFKSSSCKLIQKSTGIISVRHADPKTIPSELAIKSAQKALAKFDKSKIDALFFCGIERDFSEPSTAHIIADTLGIEANICFDISNACHGFTCGLEVARAMIATGQIEYALVTTAELPSRITRSAIDLFKSGKINAKDNPEYLGAFTIGDAGGTMIIGRSEGGSGLKLINTKALSKWKDLCYYKFLEDNTVSFSMQMAKICKKTLTLCRNMVPETMRLLNWTPSDIDIFIPHQVGLKPYLETLNIFGVSQAKSIATFPKYGNLISATLPVCYDILEQEGRIKGGMNICIFSSGSGISVSHICMVA